MTTDQLLFVAILIVWGVFSLSVQRNFTLGSGTIAFVSGFIILYRMAALKEYSTPVEVVVFALVIVNTVILFVRVLTVGLEHVPKPDPELERLLNLQSELAKIYRQTKGLLDTAKLQNLLRNAEVITKDDKDNKEVSDQLQKIRTRISNQLLKAQALDSARQ